MRENQLDRLKDKVKQQSVLPLRLVVYDRSFSDVSDRRSNRMLLK